VSLHCLPFISLKSGAHKVCPGGGEWVVLCAQTGEYHPIQQHYYGRGVARRLQPAAGASLPGHRDGAELFTEDIGCKRLSFTGSPAGGWDRIGPATEQKRKWFWS